MWAGIILVSSTTAGIIAPGVVLTKAKVANINIVITIFTAGPVKVEQSDS